MAAAASGFRFLGLCLVSAGFGEKKFYDLPDLLPGCFGRCSQNTVIMPDVSSNTTTASRPTSVVVNSKTVVAVALIEYGHESPFQRAFRR